MRITAAVGVLLAAASMLSAQEDAGWVNLQGGYVAPTRSPSSALKASSALGVGFGSWITNRWGAEVSFLKLQIELQATGLKGGETHGLVSGLYNFNPGGVTFFPFARIGLGLIDYQGGLKTTENSNLRANYHAGVGVQGFFAENLMGFLEYRETRVGTTLRHRYEAMGLLGLGYRWGGRTWAGKEMTPAASQLVPPERIILVEAVPEPTERIILVEAVPEPTERIIMVETVPEPNERIIMVEAVPEPKERGILVEAVP